MNEKRDEDYDEGLGFFAAVILAIPYGLAVWIFAWCMFSKLGCLL
jgi:hypothetical protein